MLENKTREIILKGIGGSPGICIGKAYLVDREGVDVIRTYNLSKALVQDEVNRFKSAVKKSEEELGRIIEKMPEDLRQHVLILETHMVLLKDKMLYGRTIETIENERVNAEWALKKTVSIVRPMFENMTDEYLKERAEDIAHISDRIMKNLVGEERVNIGKIDKRVILVARQLSPAETSQIQLEKIKGFVTNKGGRACHTSIIARTLNIPAVMGVGNATLNIKNDDIIVVDGTAGTVVINPSEQTLFEAEEKKERLEAQKAQITRKSHLPAKTSDGVTLKIMGNMELPEEVVSVLDNGGDGIGLYRTEFQYLSRKDYPSEEELYENYKGVVDVMPDRTIIIRTLDINGDKAVNYISDENEVNPALGLRAIRYCLHKPEIFKTQLRAILRAAVHGKVKILIPMISGLEEVAATKIMIKEVQDCLGKDNVPFEKDVQLGIMMEVPSAVMIADILAKEVDFFSIGTNDLIQYSLAVDRGNRHVAHLHHPLHPAILRMIKRVCDVGKKAGIKTFMCGEMAGEPLYAPVLLGLGVEDLSMTPYSIPAVKNMIRYIDTRKAKSVVKEILNMKTSQEVEDRVRSVYGDMIENGR